MNERSNLGGLLWGSKFESQLTKGKIVKKKCIDYPYLSKASSHLFRSVNTTYLLKASLKDATKKTNRRNRLSSERTNEYLQTAHKISPMSMTAS